LYSDRESLTEVRCIAQNNNNNNNNNNNVVSILAASYLSSSAQSAGAAADLAASRTEAKYTGLTNLHIFQPIAIESHGALNSSALSFLTT